MKDFLFNLLLLFLLLRFLQYGCDGAEAVPLSAQDIVKTKISHGQQHAEIFHCDVNLNQLVEEHLVLFGEKSARDRRCWKVSIGERLSFAEDGSCGPDNENCQNHMEA